MVVRQWTKHRRTDPICKESKFYQWIGNRLGYWWCSRNRGLSCRTCADQRRVASGLWAGTNCGCAWTNTREDAACQRCGAGQVDGYGFRI
jgi:hypothetical protein